MEGVVVVVIIAVVLGGFVWNHLAEKKRREALESLASDLGFRFSLEDGSILSRLGSMKIFSQGRSQRARNVLRGDAGGIEVVLTDYQYTTGSGKNRTTHHQTLCILSSASLDMPHCFLRPQSRLFDFLGKVFGGQDIDFEEDAAFSSAFVLQGENEHAVREVFDESARAYFLRSRQQDPKGLTQFEAGGDTLVLNPGKRRRPDELQGLMNQAFEILNLFPGNIDS